ncbi:MAG TPA: YdeI/OmpD-associated family protein [Longimicrobium sp.]|jgi:uncharacterized protein YdeI (YjbR/CyaY-like superfamily)
MKAPAADLPVILFATTDEWADWLERHHDTAPGVWMRLAKKGAEITSITYAEGLDEALCHGWIDSHKKSYDEQSWIQKFTPRGRRSIWSKVNRDKVEALVAAGRMKPAGLAAVQAARDDGRWDAAYDSQRTSTVPDDFQAALDANPAARDFFATLNGANRYAILFRIQTAKKPETRANRIATLTAMLERNEKIHS